MCTLLNSDRINQYIQPCGYATEKYSALKFKHYYCSINVKYKTKYISVEMKLKVDLSKNAEKTK